MPIRNGSDVVRGRTIPSPLLCGIKGEQRKSGTMKSFPLSLKKSGPFLNSAKVLLESNVIVLRITWVPSFVDGKTNAGDTRRGARTTTHCKLLPSRKCSGLL